MFLRFSPFPTKANLQLVGEAAVTPVLRACSQKENSAFRTMPSFLCRQQTQLNDSSLLPNMSESRNSLWPHSLFDGFDCEWPWCAMPKYRGYSLTLGSPAERRFSTTRYLFHYSQLCVLSRDKFNSCFSFVPAVTPELSALLWSCGSSPAPGASHTPWGPAAHGEIHPCRGHHPAGPSRSQQVPAAPTQLPGKALQTAPSVHSREELHQKAWAYACNYRCKWMMVN